MKLFLFAFVFLAGYVPAASINLRVASLYHKDSLLAATTEICVEEDARSRIKLGDVFFFIPSHWPRGPGLTGEKFKEAGLAKYCPLG